MPLYEYTCQACGQRFTWLVGVVADATPPTCPRCGAARAEKRAVSRFARVRTDEQALDELADVDTTSFGDPADPRAMECWSKAMGSLVGESGGLGNEFGEYIDAAAGARSGETESDNE